jgi:hypothetical protein
MNHSSDDCTYGSIIITPTIVSKIDGNRVKNVSNFAGTKMNYDNKLPVDEVAIGTWSLQLFNTGQFKRGLSV